MFIINSFFLLLNSFLLAGILGSICWIEFFTLSIIFFYSQILGISIILGLFHLLYERYILFASIFILLLLLPKIKKIKIPEIKIISPGISLIISIVFAIHISYIFNLILLPPITTDGLLYHLPFAVHYYKTHSISLPNLYFTDIALTYYPIGGEIFYLFSLFSFREFLFKFTQYPFLILGCFSVFLLMKSFGFSNFLSVIGALIFSLIKPVFKESTMEFVDLMVAATFISTIYFFKKDEKKYIFAGVLSLSLLLSIKTLSVIFAVLTLPFLFFKKKGKFTKSFYFSLVFLVLFGLFAYLRNFILTGNPLYPAEISIGNFVLFKGPYILTKMPFFEKFKNLFNILAFSRMHIDPSFHLKLILILFFFASIILSFKNKELFMLHLIFPISVILYGLLIPPFYYQIRHFLPVYTILTISLITPFKKFQYFSIPVFLYFCISVLRLPFLFYVSICFLIFLCGLLFAYYFKKAMFYFFYIIIFIFVLIFQIEKINFIYDEIKIKIWNNFYRKESSLWSYIYENSQNGKNIVYIGDFLIYPFYGKNFKNNVYYQSVNSIDTFPVYKYQYDKISENMEFYRKNPSFELWFEGLKKKKINYVVVKKEGKYIEKDWIKEHEGFFKEVFSSDFAVVYEFLW